MRGQVMGGDHRQRRIGAGLALLLVPTLVAGCSDDDSSVDPLAGWAQGQVWDQADAVDYDNVATAGYRHAVAWVTRRTEGRGLTYWNVSQGDQPVEVVLPRADAPTAIPVALTLDNHRWVAVAATRDAPAGSNTGLVAWHGDGTTTERAGKPVDLELPPGISPDQFELVTVGRADQVAVVVGLAGDRPVIWRLDTSPTGADVASTDDGAVREGERLDLDVDDLVSLRVTGDGEQLVLAGSDVDSRPHLWTSTDGRDWHAVPRDVLPREAGPATMLAAVGPADLVIGWLTPDATQRTASGVAVWRFDGEELVSMGTIEAGDHRLQRVDANDATVAPDDSVLVAGEGIVSGESVPLVWSRRDDRWELTEQEDLTDRREHRLRALATTNDDEMIALMTHLTQADVEIWRWHESD